MPKYSTTMNRSNIDPLFQELTSYNVKFNQAELDAIFSYIASDNKYVSIEEIENIKTIFSNINQNYYIDEHIALAKIKSIIRACDLRLINGLKGDILISAATGGFGSDANNFDVQPIDDASAQGINAQIEYVIARDQKTYIMKKIHDDYDAMEASNFNTEVVDNKLGNFDHIVDTYSLLSDAGFDKSDEAQILNLSIDAGNTLINAYNESISNAPMLSVTNQALAEIVDGGYKGGRIYVVVAAPSQGKSLFLLDSCIQIKESNTCVVKDGLLPAVIYFSLENSQEQTLARAYSMITGRKINEDKLNNTVQNNILKSALESTEESPTAVFIICAPDGAKTTNYIHTLFNKIKKMGYYPAALAVDYIKRIEPARGFFQLTDKLGAVTNELRNIALKYDIPVITAAQFNREGYAKVFGHEHKFDTDGRDLVTQFSIDDIADSIEIAQNADYVVFIQPEYIEEYKDAPSKYLGICRAKSRDEITFGDPNISNVFTPFNGSNIKIVDDRKKPCTLNSLKRIIVKDGESFRDVSGVDIRHPERYRIANTKYNENKPKKLDQFDLIEIDSEDATNTIFYSSAAATIPEKKEMCRIVRPMDDIDTILSRLIKK